MNHLDTMLEQGRLAAEWAAAENATHERQAAIATIAIEAHEQAARIAAHHHGADAVTVSQETKKPGGLTPTGLDFGLSFTPPETRNLRGGDYQRFTDDTDTDPSASR